MKKTRFIVQLLVLGASTFTMASCGSASNKITVWVGEESYQFYSDLCKEYLTANPDFGFDIEVKSQDTGTAAGSVIADATVAADIFTVAHDNVGKLAIGKYAKPLMNTELIAQVESDNPDSFKNVSYSTVDGTKSLYAAPYISQSLFLMYDKRYVTDEQALSFEGLTEAAKARGESVKGWTANETGGYNFSFTLLARNNETKATSLKLYEGGVKTTGSCWVQGDDEVASVKWAQRVLKDPNGMKWPSSSGWSQDIQNGAALSVIGGAWHFKTFSQSVGSSNIGLAMIPTYTLTADDAFGTSTEGTVMRGGTFADCKVFMINSASAANKYVAEQQLIKYLTSKEVQNKSFVECDNLPAYKEFADNLDQIAKDNNLDETRVKLAKVQNQMAEYGIAQPFINGTLNTYFYSKGAPELMKVIVDQYDSSTKKEVYLTDAEIQQGLYKIQYIWQHGKAATDVPETLPQDVE